MLKKIAKKVVHQKKQIKGYRFHIDNVNDKKISGWAHKIGDDNYSANIEIRNNDVTLYSTKANIFRKDLVDASIGLGKYGFDFAPSLLKVEKDIDTVDIYIDGFKANAKPLPLVLKGVKPVEVVAKVKPVITKTEKKNNVQIYIDGASVDKVFGWAKNKDSITHRSLVELKVGDIVLGSDTADKFRQSIKKAGIGDGCYCFEIIPQVHLFPSEVIVCDLYVDGNKVSTKPIELRVDKKSLENEKFKHEFADEISGLNDSLSQQLARISSEIDKQSGNSMQVAIENIALLSARVEVIEKILTKHFSLK